VKGVPILALAGLVTFAGCEARTFGLPRVAIEVASPDGTRAAIVQNHPSIDPPSQSLWISGPEGAFPLRRLAEDQQWCDTAVWAADGTRVAFLVNGVEADVYDVASKREIARHDLVSRGDDPPRRIVRDLRFSSDGKALGFRHCDRRSGADCSMPMRWAISAR